MSAIHLESIKVGLLAFLGIGFALLLAVVDWHYSHFGRLDPRRSLVLYAFLLYGLITLAVVFLPFPDPASVCNGQQAMQLTPFQWAFDVRTEMAKHQLSGIRPALGTKAFLSFAFNIALFVPFGVFLRRSFGRPLPLTLLAGFSVSLLFEITQITGNWGMYPCPYRIFDADDLIANTAGAALGWALAPVCIAVPRLLPMARSKAL